MFCVVGVRTGRTGAVAGSGVSRVASPTGGAGGSAKLRPGPTEQAGRRLRWVGKNKDAAKRLNHRNRCRYRTGEFFVIERDNDPAIHRWFDSSRPTAFSLRQQLKSHRQCLGTGKTTVLFLRPELFLSFNLVVECEVSD